MPADSPGRGPVAFDFKSASLTLEALVLKTGNLKALAAALADRFGATPELCSTLAQLLSATILVIRLTAATTSLMVLPA